MEVLKCIYLVQRWGYKPNLDVATSGSNAQRAVCWECIVTDIVQNQMKDITSMKAPQGLTAGPSIQQDFLHQL